MARTETVRFSPCYVETMVIIDNPQSASLCRWCMILCFYLRLGAGAELVSVLLFSGTLEELLTGAL